MKRYTPPRQPGSVTESDPTGAVLLRRILNHRATIPMLAGGAVMVLGSIVAVQMTHSGPLPEWWAEGTLRASIALAMITVLGVAYFMDKRRDARLAASADPVQLQGQRLYRERLEDLPADFVELRERLCRGLGGRSARHWRLKIDSAIFPEADLGKVVDQWLRKLFTVPDGPLQRALFTAGGGPVNNKRLMPADLGIPLPGARRAVHMTPAWYADRVARAAKKTATPAWRTYLSFAVASATLGVLTYLEFVAHAPFTMLAFATIAGVIVMLVTWRWSIGTNPGGHYAWHAMSHYLVAEMHAAAPHAVQPDCLDTDCPNNVDDQTT